MRGQARRLTKIIINGSDGVPELVLFVQITNEQIIRFLAAINTRERNAQASPQTPRVHYSIDHFILIYNANKESGRRQK